MKLLFLRGRLPLDFRPDRLEYDKIAHCEDMWTVFCERLSRYFDETELWYHGAGKHRKKKRVTDRFVERWVNFSELPDFVPDIIIARGGFREYKTICNRFPKAKKVYYGAGVRFKPGWGKWDLILVDSERQQRKVPGSKLFIKPAADNIFRPVKISKSFDVCFMANATQMEIKRHKLAFRSLLGTDITILHLGLCNDRVKQFAAGTKVTFGGWQRRPKLSKQICRCKIGLVCSTNYDSCPRVLPEFLACGLPVVAVDEMNFWQEKYINKNTGILCGKGDIRGSVQKLLKRKLNPRPYYLENLSVDIAAERLIKQLGQ